MNTSMRPKPLLLRGPAGRRGAEGLSAYGIWLKNGHQGTADDFLHWLKHDTDCILYHHLGGQTLLPQQEVLLLPAGQTRQKPCCLSHGDHFLAQFYICPQVRSVFSLYLDDREIFGSRFAGIGCLYGIVFFALEEKQLPLSLRLMHGGQSPVTLSGTDETVDAYMLVRPVR